MKTIEYIGAPPKKPKKKSIFGGWVIVLLMVGSGVFFGYRYTPFAFAAENRPTVDNAAVLVGQMKSSKSSSLSHQLAAAALEQSRHPLAFDPGYYKIAYPGGDIDPTKGMASDLIIRAYRSVGVDLQQHVHEDMKDNFRVYPQLWDARAADTNIDHRRVPNLHRFFERNGLELGTSKDGTDYETGDVVIWRLANGEAHIGIVVPGPGEHQTKKWVVHNIGNGPVWENSLFEYQVVGHYRY